MEFCSYCKTKIDFDEENCINCGIPLYVDEEEKSRYITNIHRTREKFQETYGALQRAKWILLIIGLATLIFHFYSFNEGRIDQGDLIVYSGLGVFLIIAGFLTSEFPLPSVSLGIVFTLGIYLYSVYLEPLGALRNIVVKGLILSALVYALKCAIEFEKMIRD